MRGLVPAILGVLACAIPAQAQEGHEFDFQPPPGVTKMKQPINAIGFVRDYWGGCAQACQDHVGSERCMAHERPFYSSQNGSCECLAEASCSAPASRATTGRRPR